MKRKAFIISFIGLQVFFISQIRCEAAPILGGSDLSNITLIALNYEQCQKQYPTSCCFLGEANLQTVFDNKSIKSFTLKGNQMGKNCPAQLEFIPAQENETQIIMNKYYIKTKTDQSSSFLFYTGYRNQAIEGQTKYDYQFTLHLSSSANAFQDFMLKNTNLPIEEQVDQAESHQLKLLLSLTNLLIFFLIY